MELPEGDSPHVFRTGASMMFILQSPEADTHLLMNDTVKEKGSSRQGIPRFVRVCTWVVSGEQKISARRQQHHHHSFLSRSLHTLDYGRLVSLTTCLPSFSFNTPL